MAYFVSMDFRARKPKASRVFAFSALHQRAPSAFEANQGGQVRCGPIFLFDAASVSTSVTCRA
jgi:hypothetical protein